MTVLDLPITTRRLRLRAYTDHDAAPLHQIYSRPDVTRFLLDNPWTFDTAVQRVADRVRKTGLDTGTGVLALITEFDGRVIGDILLWYTDQQHGLAKIGWVFDPDFGGQGFATEAASAVLNVAFDIYGVHRVVAQMDARNHASARLASRLGMHREAHLRQDWWNKGEWTDTLTYALLAGDPRGRTSSPA